MQYQLPYATLELPDDWEDRSTYQFVSPDKKIDVPPPLEPVSMGRISVVIGHIPMSDDLDLIKMIQDQKQAFLTALVGCQITDEGVWNHPTHGDVPSMILQFQIPPNSPVVQVHLYFERKSENDVIVLSFTCDATSYKARESEFLEVFSAFQLKESDL